jgi:hypothetical protein
MEPPEQFSKADPSQTVVTPPSTVHLNTASYPGQIHELTVSSKAPSDKSNQKTNTAMIINILGPYNRQ